MGTGAGERSRSAPFSYWPADWRGLYWSASPRGEEITNRYDTAFLVPALCGAMEAALVWEHLPLTSLEIYFSREKEERNLDGGQVDIYVDVGWGEELF